MAVQLQMSARGVTVPAKSPPPRKRREKVPQPIVRPDLSGAVTATVADVIAYTRLSRSAVGKLITDGRLRVVRVGRTVLVRIDSVHEVLGGPAAKPPQHGEAR